MSETLSLVVITYNEEANIRRCLESVAALADEVIVLDSGSQDQTRNIAAEMGARVEVHPFDGHIEQKNRARAMARGSLVLSLDADEALDELLRRELDRLKKEGAPCAAFTMNRLNFYRSKPIKTCGWYPDRKLRLWKNGVGCWAGMNPHDRYTVPDGTAIGHLAGDILHDTYPDKDALIRQSKKFATISARHLQGKRAAVLWFKMLFGPVFRFVRTWIFQRGFISGSRGWELCIWQAREVFLKYREALLLKKQKA
jgi:glycosyltransferase involved in cell wall biosynthesis